MASRWLSSTSQRPGALAVRHSASSVEAKMLTPSATDTTLNTFTLGLEMDISISATAEYGTIENVYLFLDGQLLNLPVAFPPARSGSWPVQSGRILWIQVDA